jgi:hypothetical protein
MTSTIAPPRPETSATRPMAPLGTGTKRRRSSWVALGVLLVAGSALGFAVWGANLGHRQLVVVAAREIPAGATIHAADLRTADVAVDGAVEVVPATSLPSLLGRVAASTIPAKALVHPAEIAQRSAIGADEAVVGVALAPGAVPVPELRVGDRVRVVAVAAPSQQELSSGLVLGMGEVFAVRNLEDAARSVVVSLLLPARDAVAVADAAGANRVRLVLLGGSR